MVSYHLFLFLLPGICAWITSSASSFWMNEWLTLSVVHTPSRGKFEALVHLRGVNVCQLSVCFPCNSVNCSLYVDLGGESHSGFLRFGLEIAFPVGSGTPNGSGLLYTHCNSMCWMTLSLWNMVHPSSLGTQVGKLQPGKCSFPSLYVPNTDTAHPRTPNIPLKNRSRVYHFWLGL